MVSEACLSNSSRTFEGRRLKCFPYWPANVDEEDEIGDFRVKNIASEIKEHYRKTRLQVTFKDEVSASF